MLNYSPLSMPIFPKKKDSSFLDKYVESVVNETVDGYYGANSKVANVLGKVRSSILEIDNNILAKNALNFLSVFVRELSYFDSLPNVLPQIEAVIEDDNIFFEWVFDKNFRIGFTIVDDVNSSSWFLFLNNENILGSLSGNFERVGYQCVIRTLLNVVMENT